MKILLIDDHALFRSGLEILLERRGIQVAATAGDGEEGLKLARETPADVILLDLRLPGLNGMDVLRRLRAEGVKTPIAMLTTSSDEQDLVESLRCGAQGYLLKEMEPDDLVVALRDIVSGRTVVAPGLTGVLAKVVRQGETEPEEKASPFAILTPRELQILHHLSEGQSNKVIARNLGISDGTVKLHVKSILRKLDVHSRVEAAVMAVEKGLASRG